MISSTLKTIKKWLTKLQKIALLAEHVQASAQQEQSKRETSTLSIRMYASTAVLALTLALLELSSQVSNLLQRQIPKKTDPQGQSFFNP